MCRSINIDRSMFQHITWREDCMVINIVVSKTDQTREGVSKEKHVFSQILLFPKSALS